MKRSKRRKRHIAKLRMYPDRILMQECEPVTLQDDIKQIKQDMMYILTNSDTGVGLAAPQAGYLKRIIVVNQNGFDFLMNPEIVWHSDKKTSDREFCLSYPGKSKWIERYTELTVEYLDENLDKQIMGCKGFYARIVQHEVDHLDGKCQVGEL